MTETEIEIFESEPDTQAPPRLKARIRQRHDQREQTRAEATETGHTQAETAERDTVSAKTVTLDEVTVTDRSPAGIKDRIKQGAAWAAAIMILAAAGWIIFKLKTHKKI